MGKLSVKTVTPLCLKSSMGKLIDSVLKIYRHDDLKWHYSCSTDRVNFRVELLTMVFIVTKCESKKVAQLFQKVTWIISWHQFLHKLFFFKLAQKSTIFYGLLFAILLPRTLKNHPIRSHCSHDLNLFQVPPDAVERAAGLLFFDKISRSQLTKINGKANFK